MSNQTAIRRFVIIANKSWEVDPLVAVLTSDRARPAGLGDFALRWPGTVSDPRLTFTCNPDVRVEVWCLQELLDLTRQRNTSNSAEKARSLMKALSGEKPAIVIAFGTAGYPEDVILNGSVVIGSRCFVHAPATSELDRYTPKAPDVVSAMQLPDDFFRAIDSDVRFVAEGRFLHPPMIPANPPAILAGHNWIAVSSVNVTNWDDFVWTDAEALATFRALDQKKIRGRVGSMESTHGLIAEVARNVPFLYVSGIANRIPYFDYQNAPRSYAQNFVAAHNAAVALAWLLPYAARRISAPRSQQGEPTQSKDEAVS